MELLTVTLLIAGIMGIGSYAKEGEATNRQSLLPRTSKPTRRVRLDRSKTPQPVYLTLKTYES